ncbi:trafficking particle complex subunit 2 [Brachionus plicatilis]|uniref:Trafficking protein particle complex subunit 2-like protein n=1 Tax=Brachionus plicatilis TaxID=10195 RepID=A0A3M7PES3_BRAPC|nr:trafficking particle complex subunit 2 [Brachionus plicatilis]
MASCIAVVAKENYPLYIKTASGSQAILSNQNLKYWYILNSSLDVVEEKLRRTDNKDLYLGLLYLIEDFIIYGYVTNTKVKFFIVIESSSRQFHDTEIKIMFKKLHTSYTSVVCNPFFEFGKPFNSRKFDEVVKSMLMKVSNPVMVSSQSTAFPANNSHQSLVSIIYSNEVYFIFKEFDRITNGELFFFFQMHFSIILFKTRVALVTNLNFFMILFIKISKD